MGMAMQHEFGSLTLQQLTKSSVIRQSFTPADNTGNRGMMN